METETPVVETPPEVEPSSLPSQNQEVDYSAFDLSDDIKTGMKDSKINGRFGSVQEILDKLKETEDKFANDVRTNKNNESKGAEDNSVAIAKQNVGSEIEKAYIANGMVLTDEMIKQGTDVGIDARDIKLRAIEIRDSLTTSHNVVGGKEAYDEMIGWARENMTDAQKKSFNGSLGTNMSEYAIKGLQADYKAALAAGTTTTRIAGQPVNQGITPYESRAQLYADKDKAELAKRRGNVNDWNIYQKKLKATMKLNGGINGIPRY